MTPWLRPFCILLLFVGGLPAATVRYFNGETAEGKIDFAARGIGLAVKGAAPVPVDLANVMEIVVRKSPVAADSFPPGAVLVNGSALADATPTIEGPTVSMGKEGWPVPTASIAWLLFAAQTREQMAKAPTGQTGGILPNGDFFAGTLVSVRGSRITLNSILFGPQIFAAKERISAVVLRDPKPVAARYLVSTIHGSRLAADDVQFDAAGLVVKDSVLGAVKLKADDIAELRAGPGRYQWLTDLTPAKVAPPPGMEAAAAVRVPKAGAAEDDSPNLVSAANAAITYLVPAGSTLFTAGLAVAQDSPANARVVFAVYGDGRPLFRSPPASPGEKTAPLRVDVRGVRAVTLRVEPTGLPTGIFGEWQAAMLLR